MNKKVIFISIDGMRPDGLIKCGNPKVEELKKICSYTFNGKACIPPVTLPCHLSMFYGVCPERHGILTNTFVPMVRPVLGIFEKIKAFGKVTAMYYGWDEMRSVASLGSLSLSRYVHYSKVEDGDTAVTDSAIADIKAFKPDFAFVYMPVTDEAGHSKGWMSEFYLEKLSIALDNAKKLVDTFGDEYYVIITADHGGHGRDHGADIPEDMTIPLFFFGEEFEKGKELKDVSLLDIAPTVMKIMDIPVEREWEGKPLF